MLDLLTDSLISTQDLWSSVEVTFRFLITSLTVARLRGLLGRAWKLALRNSLDLFHAGK